MCSSLSLFNEKKNAIGLLVLSGFFSFSVCFGFSYFDYSTHNLEHQTRAQERQRPAHALSVIGLDHNMIPPCKCTFSPRQFVFTSEIAVALLNILVTLWSPATYSCPVDKSSPQTVDFCSSSRTGKGKLQPGTHQTLYLSSQEHTI